MNAFDCKALSKGIKKYNDTKFEESSRYTTIPIGTVDFKEMVMMDLRDDQDSSLHRKVKNVKPRQVGLVDSDRAPKSMIALNQSPGQELGKKNSI